MLLEISGEITSESDGLVPPNCLLYSLALSSSFFKHLVIEYILYVRHWASLRNQQQIHIILALKSITKM